MGRRGDGYRQSALNRHAAKVEDWVRRSKLAASGLIRADELARCLRLAAVGVGDVIATDRLGETLALVAWHEQWSRPAPPAEEETIVLHARGPAAGPAVGRTLSAERVGQWGRLVG